MDPKKAARYAAAHGRYGDSMLVHMNPREVAGIASLAPGRMTINPHTGYPEAFGFDDFLSVALPVALAFVPGVGPALSAAASGTMTYAKTGSLEKGIASGMLGYGLGGMADGLAQAGTGAAASTVPNAATAAPTAATTAAAPAVSDVATGVAATGSAPAMSNGVFTGAAPASAVPAATPLGGDYSSLSSTPASFGGSHGAAFDFGGGGQQGIKVAGNPAPTTPTPPAVQPPSTPPLEPRPLQQATPNQGGLGSYQERWNNIKAGAAKDGALQDVALSRYGLMAGAGAYGLASMNERDGMDKKEKTTYRPYKFNQGYRDAPEGYNPGVDPEWQYFENSFTALPTYTMAEGGEVPQTGTQLGGGYETLFKPPPPPPVAAAPVEPAAPTPAPAAPTLGPRPKRKDFADRAQFRAAQDTWRQQQREYKTYQRNNRTAAPAPAAAAPPAQPQTPPPPPAPWWQVDGPFSYTPQAALGFNPTPVPMGTLNMGTTSGRAGRSSPTSLSGVNFNPSTTTSGTATAPTRSFFARAKGGKIGKPTSARSAGIGQFLDGAGDGMSDSIHATINEKQPARLADGEFVIPADVVSHLGNGSSKAGAKQLYSMMDRVRAARTGKSKQAPKINPKKVMPS